MDSRRRDGRGKYSYAGRFVSNIHDAEVRRAFFLPLQQNTALLLSASASRFIANFQTFSAIFHPACRTLHAVRQRHPSAKMPPAKAINPAKSPSAILSRTAPRDGSPTNALETGPDQRCPFIEGGWSYLPKRQR